MQNAAGSHSGHRERLRQRLLAPGAAALADAELIELLLTYSIPRQDVAPLACHLLEKFGDLAGLLRAPYQEVLATPGVGEQTAVLIQLVGQLASAADAPQAEARVAPNPPDFPDRDPDWRPFFDQSLEPEHRQMRTFTNDLSATALEYLPQVAHYDDVLAFKAYLEQNLPYNSFTSRERYARNLITRYFPQGSLHTPFAAFMRHGPAPDTLRPVLFYETVRAEPAVQHVAEEIIWPALPVGHVTRAQLGERLETMFPHASEATVKRMLYSLFNVYTVLNQARAEEEVLHFQLHAGTFEAFVYVLTAEFPEPGMYRFEELEQGPMRRWLLWDRDWMHRQLYNLRDLGILSKISQIDALRQFTLQYAQSAAMDHYFEHPDRGRLVLRDEPAGDLRNDAEGNA